MPYFFFCAPYFFDFAGWWPNSLTPATVVIFGPSYLRRVSKGPTLTWMRPMGVAIHKTMSSILDPHIFVTTSRRPYPKNQERSPTPPYPEDSEKIPESQASISSKFRKDPRCSVHYFLALQHREKHKCNSARLLFQRVARIREVLCLRYAVQCYAYNPPWCGRADEKERT